MTYQDIFDMVKNHLISQCAKAYLFDSTSQYAYKDANGLKCPIGALIQDAFYTPDLEGQPVESTLVLTALKDSGIITDIQMADPNMILFLKQLQQIHDVHPVADWDTALREFGNVMNLTF